MRGRRSRCVSSARACWLAVALAVACGGETAGEPGPDGSTEGDCPESARIDAVLTTTGALIELTDELWNETAAACADLAGEARPGGEISEEQLEALCSRAMMRVDAHLAGEVNVEFDGATCTSDAAAQFRCETTCLMETECTACAVPNDDACAERCVGECRGPATAMVCEGSLLKGRCECAAGANCFEACNGLAGYLATCSSASIAITGGDPSIAARLESELGRIFAIYYRSSLAFDSVVATLQELSEFLREPAGLCAQTLNAGVSGRLQDATRGVSRLLEIDRILAGPSTSPIGHTD